MICNDNTHDYNLPSLWQIKLVTQMFHVWSNLEKKQVDLQVDLASTAECQGQYCKPLETSQQIASHSNAYDTKSGLIIFDLADYSWAPLFHVFPSELPNIGTDQTLATLPYSAE